MCAAEPYQAPHHTLSKRHQCLNRLSVCPSVRPVLSCRRRCRCQAFRLATELLHKNLVPRHAHAYQHTQGHHPHLQTHPAHAHPAPGHPAYILRGVTNESEFGEIAGGRSSGFSELDRRKFILLPHGAAGSAVGAGAGSAASPLARPGSGAHVNAHAQRLPSSGSNSRRVAAGLTAAPTEYLNNAALCTDLAHGKENDPVQLSIHVLSLLRELLLSAFECGHAPLVLPTGDGVSLASPPHTPPRSGAAGTALTTPAAPPTATATTTATVASNGGTADATAAGPAVVKAAAASSSFDSIPALALALPRPAAPPAASPSSSPDRKQPPSAPPARSGVVRTAWGKLLDLTAPDVPAILFDLQRSSGFRAFEILTCQVRGGAAAARCARSRPPLAAIASHAHNFYMLHPCSALL